MPRGPMDNVARLRAARLRAQSRYHNLALVVRQLRAARSPELGKWERKLVKAESALARAWEEWETYHTLLERKEAQPYPTEPLARSGG